MKVWLRLGAWLALCAPVGASHAHWEVFDMDPVPCPSPQVTSYAVKGTSAPKFFSKAEVLADFHAFSAPACSAYTHGQYLYDAVINLTYKARYFTPNGATHGLGSYLPCADREYVRACAKVDLSLTLTGPEKKINPGDTLDGFVAKVTSASRKPVNGASIRLEAALRTQGAPHLGYLVPAFGEGAQCAVETNGEALACVTDADGQIGFSFSALPGTPSTDVVYDLAASCTDPARPCTPTKTPARTVTISPCEVRLQVTAGGAQVEPEGILEGFSLTATCGSGEGEQPVSDLAVEVVDRVLANSGGHVHGPDDSQRRLGNFLAEADDNCSAGSRPGTMVCTTGEDGRIAFAYLAPKPSGIHFIAAECADPAEECAEGAPARVEVMLDGLRAIPASPWYTLIGSKPEHPDNHYLTPGASGKLEAIAADYAEYFGFVAPRDPEQLHINDASLEWGGLFDIEGLWDDTRHAGHRKGTDADIRANSLAGAVPDYMLDQFGPIAAQNGSNARLHSAGTSNQHFHVRLTR